VTDRQSGPTTQGTDGPAFTMYSTPWCGYCHRLRSQLDREGIAYDVVDIEQDPASADLVMQVNNGNQTVPTLVYRDGTAQTNPSVKQVKEKVAALA
jgi:mycoredoxin